MTVVLISLIFILAIAAVAVFYVRLVKKLDHIAKAQDSIKKRAKAGVTRIAEDAHKQALAIIEDANRRSQEMLGEAKFLDEESKNQFQKKWQEVLENQVLTLRKVSDELVESYRSALAKLSNEESMALKNVSESIKEEGLREIGAFKNVLEQETIGSQKVVEQKIADEYARVKGEIEAYRQEMLKKVHAQIFTILQAVSKEVIGKALNLSEHEELVLQALDEAKKKGILDSGR